MKENGFTLEKARSTQYPTKIISDMEYTDDIALLVNTPTQAESLLHCVEQTVGGIGHHVNVDKTECMCFNERVDISRLNCGSLKLVDKFTYLRSSVSSTKMTSKAWSTINRLSLIWESDQSNKIKCNFSKQWSCSYYYIDALHGCWQS